MAKKGRSTLGRPEAAGSTSLPVYYQLYLTLREQLRDGAFARDAPMPSEAKLAERFGVSRVTVRRTLQLLEQDRLVERRRGVGTFPAAPEAAPAGTSALGNLITLGAQTTVEELLWDEVSAPPPRIVAALGIAGDPACLTIERLRRHGAVPFSLTTLWLPAAVAALLDRTALDDTPIVELVERAGRPAATADQTLSAQLAGDPAARLLDTAIGAPLISLRRIVRDPDGSALLYQHSLYDPDRTEYAMQLTRDDGSPRPHWQPIG